MVPRRVRERSANTPEKNGSNGPIGARPARRPSPHVRLHAETLAA
jgi:hypothetical protein